VGALAGADAREQVDLKQQYVHRRTRESQKVIIDSQYVDKSERLWN
jgi:hypothetical protein